MSARPSQPPVEVIPAAKRLTRDDASGAIMKTIAMTLARRGLDATTIRSRMATYAAIAADQAIAWVEEHGSAAAPTGDELGLAASVARGKVVSP